MPVRSISSTAIGTITAVIADDEPLARNELTFLLKDFPDVEIVGTAANGLEAVDLIEGMEPDIVFLDVQMPGLDGLGVIQKLQEMDVPLPHFIMATAFDQYAIEAFRLDALDYLLKPVEKDRLAETVNRARHVVQDRQSQDRQTQDRQSQDRPSKTGAPGSAPRTSLQRSKILVKNGGRNLIVDAQDIVYATIDDGLITLVTSSIEGESNYRTLEDLQSNLDPESFWRVHRSFLVNIHRIREVIPWFKSSYQIRMDDKKQTEIPVSRVQTKRLRSLLKL